MWALSPIQELGDCLDACLIHALLSLSYRLPISKLVGFFIPASPVSLLVPNPTMRPPPNINPKLFPWTLVSQILA